jgi:hypothetical protein
VVSAKALEELEALQQELSRVSVELRRALSRLDTAYGDSEEPADALWRNDLN